MPASSRTLWRRLVAEVADVAVYVNGVRVKRAGDEVAA